MARTLAIFAFFALAAPAAIASPILPGIEYVIHDHPDGTLAPPTYALRLDGLDGNANHEFTFSADTNGALLTILFDDAEETLTIEGTVWGGEVSGNAYVAPQLFAVSFVYDGLTDFGDRIDTVPGGGSGTITALGAGGMGVGPFTLGQSFTLVDKANDEGLAFRLNFGHRLDDDEVVTGFGWLTHDGITPRTASQDWIFTVGEPIPEPGTALLLGAGLVMLAGQRRRR